MHLITLYTIMILLREIMRVTQWVDYHSVTFDTFGKARRPSSSPKEILITSTYMRTYFANLIPT